jgi:hypothetical protein
MAQELKTVNLAAIIKSKDLKALYKELRKKLEFIRKQIKKYYNIKKIKRLTFLGGDIIYLTIKNIIIK